MDIHDLSTGCSVGGPTASSGIIADVLESYPRELNLLILHFAAVCNDLRAAIIII